MKPLLVLSLGLVIFSCISCGVSDSDTPYPTDILTEDNFYHNNDDQIQEMVDRMYESVMENHYYGINFLLLSSIPSDIVETLNSTSPNVPSALEEYQEIDRLAGINSSPTVIRNFWNAAGTYSGSRSVFGIASSFIRTIANNPDLEVSSQEVIDHALGQAHFFKGLSHFDLNKMFGGMPDVVGELGGMYGYFLEESSTTDDCDEQYEECEEIPPPPLRPSLADSYAYIESDLQQAIELLPPSFAESGKLGQVAAIALLARLYLYTRDWQKAEDYASQVIEDYSLSLSSDYSDIFQNIDSPGNIFTLSLDRTLWNWHLPADQGGYQYLAIHKQFAERVRSRSDDTRNLTINSYEYEGDTVYYTTKLKPVNGQIHLPILRLAEMYLIRSEARARSGAITGAVSDLNVVRNRAGLPDAAASSVDNTEKVLQAIALERSIEFMGEGHRWFDLVRTGRAMDVLKDIQLYNGDTVTLDASYKQLFPIPGITGEWQNPGY